MQYRPLAASIAKWHDVSVQEQITIKGGLNRRGEVVESIRYKCADGATHTFVALHKEAMWFLKGVGGISMRKGDLKVVNVLNMLRHKVKENDFAPLGAASSPAVAGSDSQSSVADTLDDDDDPMESMISIESVADSLGDVVPRNPKQRKVDRACVQELSVPTRPACVSGASKEETQIFVYTAPDKKNNPPSTYVLIVSAGCCRTQPTNWLAKAFRLGTQSWGAPYRGVQIAHAPTYTWNGTSHLNVGKPFLSKASRKAK